MKTAMEWLIEMLHSPVCNTFINGQRRIIPHQIILDAKEKHKKEIIEAYIMGSISLTSRTEAEEYYNQTYNQTNVGNDGFEFDNSSTIPPPKNK
jgi:arginine decarboxylase-like protein